MIQNGADSDVIVDVDRTGMTAVMCGTMDGMMCGTGASIVDVVAGAADMGRAAVIAAMAGRVSHIAGTVSAGVVVAAAVADMCGTAMIAAMAAVTGAYRTMVVADNAAAGAVAVVRGGTGMTVFAYHA